MDAELRGWLLACPAVKFVSILAVDSAESDPRGLQDAIAIAVADAASDLSRDRRVRWQSPGRPMHRALRSGRRPNPWRLTVASDTIVVSGFHPSGVTILHGPGSAAVHVKSTLPQTAIATLPGRTLGDVLSIEGLPLDRYSIEEVWQDAEAMMLWFEVPSISIEDVLDACSSGGSGEILAQMVEASAPSPTRRLP